MSRRTGDKARHNRQAKQRTKMRMRVRELRAALSKKSSKKPKASEG